MLARLITATALTTALALPAVAGVDRFETDVWIDRSAMQTEASAEAAYDDVREQVERACRHEFGHVNLSERRLQNQCVVKTLDNAIDAIDEPVLGDIHAARTGA